jgi:hypothetical protein
MPYFAGVATDLWLGAATTLIGAALGGSISFIMNRQQLKSAWMQREADAAREQRIRSEDRRFAAYSEFITRARSCRNALEAYYQHPDNKPSIKELDALLQAAKDASSLVFLVVGSEEAYGACLEVMRSLEATQDVLHSRRSSSADSPWIELNPMLGKSTRTFQNAVRTELGVTGPAKPWDSSRHDRKYKKAHQRDDLGEL